MVDFGPKQKKWKKKTPQIYLGDNIEEYSVSSVDFPLSSRDEYVVNYVHSLKHLIFR